MEEHKSAYFEFIPGGDDGWDRYIVNLRKNSTKDRTNWGGHIEIDITSNQTKKHIRIKDRKFCETIQRIYQLAF